MTTRLFDTGIFDSGIFKTDEASTAPGIFSTPPFDTGIFDHPTSTGIFDTGIFDRNIYDNILGPITARQTPGGGGRVRRPAPIWSEVSWFRKKKKPKKEELVEEVAEVVEQALPAITEGESRIVAQRIVSQVSYAQLRQIRSLEAFIARVEAELAEMDDEEVLLLAA
jgi:hypothetical protein